MVYNIINMYCEHDLCSVIQLHVHAKKSLMKLAIITVSTTFGLQNHFVY